ncbi:bestrophin family protein [Undibacterium sp. CY21W]|uniref:bestrophin family protein n=1 Tax=Undibacterium sp. CY21W TaxID=2762293 RepID=UPI00164CC698|nr:bestrophin family protein [Undibacterium sp. CY21W]MBC3929831.1 bestrophin family protein [Undibacterium sp. CY21W]
MIVRDRPSGFRLFLMLRGSVLPRILPALTINILIATLVTMSHGDLFELKITLTTIPFTLIGLPISIFLGFRNNTAYDRFWEARKLWGELLIRSRNLSRQCQSLIAYPITAVASNGLADIRVRMIYRAIAFSYALKNLLRDLPGEDMPQWLTQEEVTLIQSSKNKPDFLINRMALDLQQSMNEKRIDPCLAANIDTTLSAITAAAAACERIKNTPIPFSYTLLLHRTAYIYCFLLPFGLVDSIGFMTPFVVAIVAYTFFGLDALGDEIEEPFGLDANDLPLDAICRAIEIDLLEAIKHDPLPDSMIPVGYRLT